MTPQAAAFAGVRAALEAAGVPYAIGGSWASIAFGEPRMTNDIDVLADFSAQSLDRFAAALSREYYLDADEARRAFRAGRSFNVVHTPTAFKLDLFPARAFPLGVQELDRAVIVSGTQLSEAPTPFITAEDILLAKLHWYRSGGEVSEMQWRDIQGVIRIRGELLDRDYLNDGAARLGVTDLLERAFRET